jgi:hypothetical protein
MKPSEAQVDYKLLTVGSNVFIANGDIPKKYTCEGENVNPPLDVKGTPEEAKSLALIMDDPDAPGKTFVHWVVWNIPLTRHIDEDELPGEQGVNDFGDVGYGGPCPPTGKHRYYFKLYALDNLIDLERGSTKQQLEQAMAGHIVAFGELMGHYKRMMII